MLLDMQINIIYGIVKSKAKVPTNDVVGYTDGKPTHIINIYRRKPNKDGIRPVHITPGKER